MKILKLIKNIFNDESGIAGAAAAAPVTAAAGLNPLLLGGLLLGGGTLLGALGSPKKKTIDPYGGLRTQYTDYLSGKLGTSTPFEANPAFDLPQPAVESEVEKGILGKLQNPPATSKNIMDISQKYYNARKTQLGERHEREVADTNAMYNRLGLVSSSPGLKAVTDLKETQGQEFDTLESELMQDSINKEIMSLTLGEDIYNKYLSQGQVLGQAQRGYSQFPIQQSEADIGRMTGEELSYASLAGSLIGGNPPQTYFQPGVLQKLGGGVSDIGSLIMMSKILGG